MPQDLATTKHNTVNAALREERTLPLSASIDRDGAVAAPVLVAPLHALNLPVFAGALITGVLLFSPTLRAMLMSGYSESIRALHRWFGRGQILLALAIVALWMRSVRRRGPDAGAWWRSWRLTHVSLVGAAALGLAGTGIVISSPSAYSLSVVDYSLAAHLWLTYLSCALAGVHAFLAIRHPHQRELLPSSIRIGRQK